MFKNLINAVLFPLSFYAAWLRVATRDGHLNEVISATADFIELDDEDLDIEYVLKYYSIIWRTSFKRELIFPPKGLMRAVWNKPRLRADFIEAVRLTNNIVAAERKKSSNSVIPVETFDLDQGTNLAVAS